MKNGVFSRSSWTSLMMAGEFTRFSVLHLFNLNERKKTRPTEIANPELLHVSRPPVNAYSPNHSRLPFLTTLQSESHSNAIQENLAWPATFIPNM